jgi:hypothetical protein
MRLKRWLEERRTEESFTWERNADAYLDEWCSEGCGWLRKTASATGILCWCSFSFLYVVSGFCVKWGMCVRSADSTKSGSSDCGMEL